MEYLKKYGLTDTQINKIQNRYDDGIIEFLSENVEFVENTINYLYSENIKCIFWLMMNNIKIFIETQITIKRKIEQMKQQGLQAKEIQMILLQERE